MKRRRKRVGGAYLLREAKSDVVRAADEHPKELRPATLSSEAPPTRRAASVELPRPPRLPEDLADVELPTPLSEAAPPPPATRSRLRLRAKSTEAATPAPTPTPPPADPLRTDRVGPVRLDALDSAQPDETADGFLEALRTLCTSGPEDAEVALAPVLRDERALPLLVANFPGPLWFDRRQPHRRLPRGEQVSAIGLALTRIGEPAVPYLVDMLLVPQADLRFYAALLAADMASPDLAHPLARLTLDRDWGVRRAAIAALRRHATLDGYDEVMEQLRDMGADPKARPVWRARALTASAQLGNASVLEALVDALGSRDRTLARAAHEGLKALTCHDLGAMRLPWRRWARRHGRQHRVTWLIEALADRRDELRLEAFRELQRMSGESFGLSEGSPREAFLEARSSYARWWQRRR